MNGIYHIPVLAEESISGLNLLPGSVVVDATFGGGGHAELILSKLENGKLFAFDQDEDAAANIPKDPRFFFIRHNFRYVRHFLNFYGVNQIDAAFADLGVSSHDFDVPERGFSFRFEGALDMRMNRNAEKDAFKVINQYPEEKLVSVFRTYGEIQNASRLASEIVKKRQEYPIKTTLELKSLLVSFSPKGAENKYFAQVFQALRIEVNDEMDALKEFLGSIADMLRPGGRLVIITYHSLEDRLCKNFMKTGNFEGNTEKDFYGNVLSPFRLINRKVIVPGEEEMKLNSRSRSAKLRIAEKI